jgi:hypothetical protein
MSADPPDELGRHHFLPWARQGISATLTNPDYGGALPTRGAVTVQLSVTAQNPPSVNAVAPVHVQTFGPGDVLGLDPRHIVRTEPREYTTNFEPNYLAGIEFDAPDLPWMFTPAAPAGDRLRPWVALIVLAQAEFTPAAGVVHPLPAIDVTSVAALQSLDDSWNWAHVQVSGDGGLSATATSSPSAVISRLLCPRRLEPETAYTAFLVPAFEAGRLAGLGMDVPGGPTGPAWGPDSGAPLRLPVYFQFRFNTADQGDFESLVRRLTPRKLGANIGQRAMAVDSPMPGIPSAGPPLGLEGALRSIVAHDTSWGDPGRAAFQSAVAALVNRTAPRIDDPTGPDPEVVPPMYGRWAAGVSSVAPYAPPPATAGWLNELSLDPRNRAAGGMGTQVVQSLQTALMASAWQQVAGIEAANAALRAAQLARATMTRLHSRMAVSSPTSVLTLTAPLHARLLASPVTVRAAIDTSRVPVRLLSPTARRLAHPRGVIRRRQAAVRSADRLSGPITQGGLLDAVNAQRATLVPPPAPPGGLVAMEDIGAQRGPDWQRLFPLTVDVRSRDGSVAATLDVTVQSAGSTGSVRASGLGPSTITLGAISSLAARPDFALSSPPAGLRAAGVAEARAAAAGTGTGTGTGKPDSPEAERFRSALADLANVWAAPMTDAPLAPALNLPYLGEAILSRLDPAATVPARVLSRIGTAARLNWHPPDPIREIMAAPTFPQPMYAPLRDLSEQYVLPGADQIPVDTVGLLETNHAFIEAYMVGLSHEMARQMLFAGYPTDLMGTYFRQFWDVSAYVAQPTDPTDPAALAELLHDIPPIVGWPLSQGLGQHENRTDIAADNVVLIVKGELLRRYPDAMIYAARATLSGQQRVIDDTDERHPLFSGTLPGDMTFLGFNLSAADAKGGTPSAPHGFFFVFQQHPTGPRFGLEPSAAGLIVDWADLAWTNFGSQPADTQPANGSGPPMASRLVGPWTEQRLASSRMREVIASHPIPPFLSAAVGPSDLSITGADADSQWGVDAAQTAYITARLPFRVAIHGELMVPQS